MRFVNYLSKAGTQRGIALRVGGSLRSLAFGQAQKVPTDIQELIRRGPAAMQEAAKLIEAHGDPLVEGKFTYLPPGVGTGRIICVGLNYLDHTKESKFEQPKYPTLFLRVASSFVGHEQALVRPRCSTQFDYEGEMVAYIGKPGRHIPKASALDHVAGYSVSNEGSVRDYQFKSPQWTVGKNFDQSGSIGPDFVTADEVPPGGAGLKIETRVNGETVQSANTSGMVFDLATVISLVSEAIALEPGDLILTGTPAGVGLAREPQLFLRDGDVVEVEVQGIGLLRNRVRDEAKLA